LTDYSKPTYYTSSACLSEPWAYQLVTQKKQKVIKLRILLNRYSCTLYRPT